MRRPTVVVYTREGCKLCAAAEQAVVELADGRADVRVIDIDGDEALVERYSVRVPVVAVDGVEVAELVVDPAEVSAAIAARART